MSSNIGVNVLTEHKLYNLGGVVWSAVTNLGHSSLYALEGLLALTCDAVKLCLTDCLKLLFVLFPSDSLCLVVFGLLALTGNAGILDLKSVLLLKGLSVTLGKLLALVCLGTKLCFYLVGVLPPRILW